MITKRIYDLAAQVNSENRLHEKHPGRFSPAVLWVTPSAPLRLDPRLDSGLHDGVALQGIAIEHDCLIGVVCREGQDSWVPWGVGAESITLTIPLAHIVTAHVLHW